MVQSIYLEILNFHTYKYHQCRWMDWIHVKYSFKAKLDVKRKIWLWYIVTLIKILLCSTLWLDSYPGSNPQQLSNKILKYSKASRYTASRSADLGDTQFFIGSQNTWDTRILVKSLEDTQVLIFFGNYTHSFYWI